MAYVAAKRALTSFRLDDTEEHQELEENVLITEEERAERFGRTMAPSVPSVGSASPLRGAVHSITGDTGSSRP